MLDRDSAVQNLILIEGNSVSSKGDKAFVDKVFWLLTHIRGNHEDVYDKMDAGEEINKSEQQILTDSQKRELLENLAMGKIPGTINIILTPSEK